mmetsp:Transcript_8544/g.13193  ORF Transcript_8544/g.13193 Transcript_8544/m.13193 type:complete len:102 (-) Transcript_8544:886-1191(-)
MPTKDSSSNSKYALEGGAFSAKQSSAFTRQKENWKILSNLNGLGVFNQSKGIGAPLTPVSRHFAPEYASTHSLIANTISYNTARSIKKQKRDIFKEVAPVQ